MKLEISIEYVTDKMSSSIIGFIKVNQYLAFSMLVKWRSRNLDLDVLTVHWFKIRIWNVTVGQFWVE